ncbi:MAG: peptidoglycan DD-metalloendopeptidase family protein [Actinomycetota bacterium]|nr:peptidoglycan DD-metalloendopeptidase family protein [Actinomycetota bacterium]
MAATTEEQSGSKAASGILIGLLVVSPIGLLMVLVLGLVVAFGALSGQAQAQTPCSTPIAGGSNGDGNPTGAVRLPVVGPATVTSNFGMRVNPGGIYKGKLMLHDGIDIAETSPRLVVAAMAGTVTKVYTDTIGTNIVVIDVGQGVQMSYLHLASFNPTVKAGTKAWPGMAVGVEGATGNVSGPHLHFQIHVNNTPTDPRPWMAKHGVTLPAVGGTVTGAPAATTAPSGPKPIITPFPATVAASTSASGTTSSGGQVLPPPGTPRQDSLHNPPLSIPADIKALYVAAGKRFGIPWPLLGGIGMEETGHGRNTGTSSAGAQGDMQFMPATFAEYGVDGNGDGVKDIRNPADSIFTAANYLVQSGAKSDVRKAIFAYNHADWYVNDVLYYAQAYGGGQFSNSPINVGCTDAPPGGIGAAAAPGYEAAAVAEAKKWLGTPYVWGGGGVNGPTGGGFDCSGLVQDVVYVATGKKLTLPRVSGAQYTTATMATVATYSGSGPMDLTGMRPGDVIVFNVPADQDPWGHVGIYVGNGQVIHAPRPGTVVRVADLKTDLTYQWAARRPLAQYTGASAASTAAFSQGIN